jgi:hypothetical protein
MDSNRFKTGFWIIKLKPKTVKVTTFMDGNRSQMDLMLMS